MTSLRKLLRYAGVSAISTSVSLSILGLLVATGTTSPGWANVIATAVGTVPSFELNRRWVWGKGGRRSAREVAPFWVLSFSGLALSTLAVSLTSRWATAAGWTVGARTVVAEAANVATFGSLWVAQFFLLDRVLFRPSASVVLLDRAPDDEAVTTSAA
ncbi:MAG TPA: GtrA family protein [Acidimicrobiales bacterium]|jgi:putative flippase GtrA|nr:GtrA family protein [Acidimicrobiales bacterium]